MTVSGALLIDHFVRQWAELHEREWELTPLHTLTEKARDALGTDGCRAALALLSVWNQHQPKFPTWRHLAADRQSAEQASGERAARWRAGRLSGCTRILDLCCGIGGDAIALSSHCEHLVAIDRDFQRALCARFNVSSFGHGDRTDVVCSDVGAVLTAAEAAVLDPDRRPGGRRVIRPELYEPPACLWAQIRKSVRTLAVKVAPGIPFDAIPADAVPEFVEDRGECREAVLWFGERKPHARTAVILGAGSTVTASCIDASAPESFQKGEVGRFVYDPSPAVVRAQLVTHLAAKLSAWRLDDRIAYLSSDSLVETPFARGFEVLSVIPFSLKRLRAHLRDKRVGAVEIRTRRFPVNPDELRPMLDLRGPESATVILTRVRGNALAIVCRQGNSGGLI